MDDVERLLKGSVEELERLLNAKHVLAEPIEKNGSTVIPLVSYGFGFGAGGGSDSKNGIGGGTGAGGGIKPQGAIIIDKDGARVESFKSSVNSVLETLAEGGAKMMEKKAESLSSSKTPRKKSTAKAS